MGEAENTVTRRQVLTGVGMAAAGAALAGALSGCDMERKDNRTEAEIATEEAQKNPSYNEFVPEGFNASNTVDLTVVADFYDLDHPCGVRDPAQQRYCSYATFNMKDGTTRENLQWVLAEWSRIASILQTGKPLGKVRPMLGEGQQAKADNQVPKDTGEAYDLYPASLTFTFGFGPTLFDDRFGIADFKPAMLEEFGRITDDRFDPSEAGSDLCVQVCADDPQVVFHGLRALVKATRRYTRIGFVQNGFMPLRKEGDQTTPRDLFGFRDGTTNPTEDDEFDEDVWVSGSDQEWMNGSTYMIYRKTYTQMEAWDNMRITEQERLIGRRKDSGAPLSNPDGDEFTIPDFDAVDEDGNLLINPNGHIAITSDIRLGFKIFRRAYNYWDGLNEMGYQDIGFLNIAYTNDPKGKFFKLRDDMGKYDELNEYYYDIGSGVYAVPNSPKTGHYIGQEFFTNDADPDAGDGSGEEGSAEGQTA